jgi:nucleoside-diphosphate-sugar epimerase
MNIFVAGATGVIGRPLVKLLRHAGHDVTGTTRSAAKIAEIEKLGGKGVVADALDAEALRRAVIAAKPDVVIHQLTDLPDVSDPAQMAREKNSRVRIEGTRNLMAAAKAASVRRVIAQSIAFVYAPGKKPYREGDPLDESEAQRTTIAGVKALEDAVLNTPGIDGIVLRYGRLYGPGTWFDKPGSAGEFVIDKARRELGFDPAFRA